MPSWCSTHTGVALWGGVGLLKYSRCWIFQYDVCIQHDRIFEIFNMCVYNMIEYAISVKALIMHIRLPYPRVCHLTIFLWANPSNDDDDKNGQWMDHRCAQLIAQLVDLRYSYLYFFVDHHFTTKITEKFSTSTCNVVLWVGWNGMDWMGISGWCEV